MYGYVLIYNFIDDLYIGRLNYLFIYKYWFIILAQHGVEGI